MNSSNPFPECPEVAVFPRRRMLQTLPAICGSLFISMRDSRAQTASSMDAAIAARVRSRVIARESLTDAIRPFRQGAAAVIAAAMDQYVSVQAEFAGRTPARLLALRWALAVYVDESRRALYSKETRCQHIDGSVTSFPVNTFKCNKLVADAYASGAGRGLSVAATWHGSGGNGTGWPAMQDGTELWPPKANELAEPNKNIRSLTNARPLRLAGEPKAAPELGDLIAFPARTGAGHVGLYLGRDLIVSAKESGVEVHPLAYERAMHDNIVVIRKFTGTGQ